MYAEENPLVEQRFGLVALRRVGEAQRCAPVWLDRDGTSNWGDFLSLIDSYRAAMTRAGVARRDVVVTLAASSLHALARIFAAAELGCVVAPLRPDRLNELEGWKEHVRIDWIVGSDLHRDGSGSVAERGELLFRELELTGNPGLILATGGTTGKPKLVLHDLARLWQTLPVISRVPSRILPLMFFDHIGGLDIVWRALTRGHIIVAPPPTVHPDTVAETIAHRRVEIMPATPSFLQMLILAGSVRRYDLSSLRHVPYGAESMPRSVLLRLTQELPHVTFSERFGTSETGALPVTRRGIAGLALRNNTPGYEWKAVGQELWIKSPTRALGYLTDHGAGMEGDGWFRTGDLVEVRPDGGFRVLGRREEIINVGGEKVLPHEIEEVLLSHPLIGDCRVFAASNGILGQVVAIEVVWQGPEQDPIAVKRILRVFCARHNLAPEKLPVTVHLVTSIDGTRNLKKARGATE